MPALDQWPGDIAGIDSAQPDGTVLGCTLDNECPPPDGGVNLRMACCNHACVDLNSAGANCGACGNNCGGTCCTGFCANMANDPANCGACGKMCTPMSVQAATCVMSQCSYSMCSPSYADCDGNRANGCEVNIATNAANCGGCAKGCSNANITPSCSSTVCNGACSAGYADCDKDKRTNGCEVNLTSDVVNCGGCGVGCSTTNITPSCASGVCTGTCKATFADCDKDKLTNGCEVNLNTDAANCGACGMGCSTTNITPSCGSGACNGACNNGFADCDKDKRTNGCEINVSTDPLNCGACGMGCSKTNIAMPSCASGLCNGTCNAGFLDCNANKQTDGCEVNPISDSNNCGHCGNACQGSKVCVGGSCSCSGTFASKADYATGSGVQSVTTGDWNGDGKPDLVTANASANTVSVLLGSATGVFQVKADYAASGAQSVTAGDWNGDGKADLAVAGGGLSILLGNGNGTFQAAVSNNVGGVQSIATGDWNGDGKADLVVAQTSSSNLSVLLGNGNGTFQAKVNYATASAPRFVVSVDLNGDGKADLVTANDSTNNISVLMGNGNGTFQARVDYASGNWPFAVATGDLNGDGKTDLFTANAKADANTVSVFFGNGDGTFQSKVDYATGTFPFSVASADLNGDGKVDLAVANLSGNTVSILLGNGDGTLQAKVDHTVGAGPYSVVARDLNGDGKPDLVTANSADTVSVLLNSCM